MKTPLIIAGLVAATAVSGCASGGYGRWDGGSRHFNKPKVCAEYSRRPGFIVEPEGRGCRVTRR